MICSWNTRKESFVENQEGEFDRPNAGPEKNNDGELKPQKMIQLVSEIWRNQELLLSGLIDHMELVYARNRIGTQTPTATRTIRAKITQASSADSVRNTCALMVVRRMVNTIAKAIAVQIIPCSRWISLNVPTKEN